MKTEEHGHSATAAIAAAIGEPARARMLYSLMDGHARTSTELAAVAEVSASTASAHLNRLTAERLVKVMRQGRHRYYRLEGPQVAAALEALDVLAGGARGTFVPNTPAHLRAARTCYDHIAGSLGVGLHDRMHAMGWLAAATIERGNSAAYDLTAHGEKGLASLGVDVRAARAARRSFAYACVDWSERRPHIGGALGACLLNLAIARRWVVRDAGERSLEITRTGRRELLARFGLKTQA